MMLSTRELPIMEEATAAERARADPRLPTVRRRVVVRPTAHSPPAQAQVEAHNGLVDELDAILTVTSRRPPPAPQPKAEGGGARAAEWPAYL